MQFIWAELDPSSITTTHIHIQVTKKSVETSTLLFIFTHDPNVQLSREDCLLRNRFCVAIVWVNPTTQEWLEFYLWQTCVANLGRGAVSFFPLCLQFIVIFFKRNRCYFPLIIVSLKSSKSSYFVNFKCFAINVNVADFEPLYQSIH